MDGDDDDDIVVVVVKIALCCKADAGGNEIGWDDDVRDGVVFPLLVTNLCNETDSDSFLNNFE